MITPRQRVWMEMLRRRLWPGIPLVFDARCRELGRELKRAAAAHPREDAPERMRLVFDKFGEHLGIGRRP